MRELSAVIPFFNEAENLPLLRQRLEQVLEQIGVEYEIVLVDDCSTDDSSNVALRWARENPRVTYLRLSRNSGSHVALFAGLHRCNAECAVLLAADLQDPPETIREMLHAWRQGNHVVWAYADGNTSVPATTKVFSRLANRWISSVVLPGWPAKGADFLLLDRQVVEALRETHLRNTSLPATVVWLGFRHASVPYVKQGRQHGRSKWGWWRKLKLLVDTTVSFSYLPIRVMSLLGILMATCGFAYALVIVIGRLSGWVAAGTGYAALMTVMLIGQGMLMLMLGVLGEYLWRTLDEARARPLYVIEKEFVAGKTGVENGRPARWSDEVVASLSTADSLPLNDADSPGESRAGAALGHRANR